MQLSDLAQYYNETVKPAVQTAWDKTTGLTRLNERGIGYWDYSTPNRNGLGWNHHYPEEAAAIAAGIAAITTIIGVSLPLFIKNPFLGMAATAATAAAVGLGYLQTVSVINSQRFDKNKAAIDRGEEAPYTIHFSTYGYPPKSSLPKVQL